MKTKLIKQERLKEFPYTIPGAYYHHVYVSEYADGRVVVFSGNDWPRTQNVDCVVFRDLPDITIMRLQLILSYGTILKKMVYKTCFRRLMAITPGYTVSEFAQSILADEEWVRDILSIKPELKNLGAMSIGNAYALSKLKEIKPLLESALELPPTQFIPMAMAQVYEEKKARR